MNLIVQRRWVSAGVCRTHSFIFRRLPSYTNCKPFEIRRTEFEDTRTVNHCSTISFSALFARCFDTPPSTTGNSRSMRRIIKALIFLVQQVREAHLKPIECGYAPGAMSDSISRLISATNPVAISRFGVKRLSASPPFKPFYRLSAVYCIAPR